MDIIKNRHPWSQLHQYKAPTEGTTNLPYKNFWLHQKNLFFGLIWPIWLIGLIWAKIVGFGKSKFNFLK
jgi:hypothetical protein